MRIEVWSDVVCVWCYIGHRRLEKALSRFEHTEDVELVWRSFQLDPSHPKGAPAPARVVVAQKTGASVEEIRATADKIGILAAQEGLRYDFDRSVLVNTFDAHRLIHLAREYNLSTEMHSRLMRAHFADGETLDDIETLARLGGEVGLPAERVRRGLTGDEYAKEVDEDISEAHMLGVTSVPSVVLDRSYRLSGAQSVDDLLSALRKAHDGASESMQG